MIRFFKLIFLSLAFFPAIGQLDFLQCTDTSYCVPAVSGLPRSKGVIIQRESFLRHDMNVSPNEGSSLGSSENAVIGQNERWKVKLRSPLVMREDFNLAIGLGIEIEEFNFSSSESLQNPILRELEDKALRSLGVGLYLSKPFRGNRYIIARLQSDLNGDWNSGINAWYDYLRVSAAGVYGVKLDADRSIGIGVSYNYAFGEPTVVPVLAYFHTFSPRLGIEALLPASLRLRYMPTEKNVVYTGVELRGANYLTELSNNGQELFLENSEVRAVLNYERELHDWLWISTSLGFRRYLGFDLSDNDALRFGSGKPALTAEIEGAFMYSVGLFMVPPRAWLE